MQDTQTVAGRYRLVEVIGRGGMSDVWEAVDGRDGRHVALKVVRSDDPAVAARLEREAHALAVLDHPGLVRLLDAGSSDGHPWVAMELVTGGTLAAALRNGPLDVRRTARVGAEVAEALAYVHGAGIVHRDIKPSNVLLDDAGTARLADFGIARLTDATGMTVTGTTVGTVGYMAPEQLERNDVGPAADVWALGIVLLECLTGVRAYEGTPGEVIARRLAGPVALPAGLPPLWRTALDAALRQQPADRLSAAELAGLLRGGMAALPTAPLSLATDVATTDVLGVEAEPTDVLPAGAAATVAPGRPAPPVPTAVLRHAATGRRQVLLGAVVVAALLALILGRVFGGSSPTVRTTTPAAHAATTAPAGTAPPTTAAGPAALLGTLAADLSNATAAGSIPTDAATRIGQHAQQAVSASTTGSPAQTGPQLAQAATVLADSVAAGAASPAAAAPVQGDLTRLAAALGVPGAATPTPTPPGTTATPQHVHGDGKGGGGGNGGGDGGD